MTVSPLRMTVIISLDVTLQKQFCDHVLHVISRFQDENLAETRTKFVPGFNVMCDMFYDMVIVMNRSVQKLTRVEHFLFQQHDVDEEELPPPPTKTLKVTIIIFKTPNTSLIL